MALILNVIYNGYSKLLDARDDRLGEEFQFIKSPIWIFSVMILYNSIVYYFGPKIMRKRPAFELKRLIMTYNIAQVYINFYIIWKGFHIIKKMNIFCSVIDYSISEDAISLLRLIYIYHFIKIFDLLDTIFFILRKKENQITFLHLYHHIGMVCLTWIATVWFPGGQNVYLGFYNCIVHVFMYFYYFLTSYECNKENIWWKKYITQLQLAQHTMIFFNYLVPFLNMSCGFPKLISWFMLPQCVIMISLFLDFYIKAYVDK